jgi:deoxycytidylate deaminase
MSLSEWCIRSQVLLQGLQHISGCCQSCTMAVHAEKGVVARVKGKGYSMSVVAECHSIVLLHG